MNRDALLERWWQLTRVDLPGAARARGWPVHLDHCFQRILLDHAAGGAWRESIAAPAWRNIDDTQLAEAVRLGEAALAGTADMNALNTQSLRWRGKLD